MKFFIQYRPGGRSVASVGRSSRGNSHFYGDRAFTERVIIRPISADPVAAVGATSLYLLLGICA